MFCGRGRPHTLPQHGRAYGRFATVHPPPQIPGSATGSVLSMKAVSWLYPAISKLPLRSVWICSKVITLFVAMATNWRSCIKCVLQKWPTFCWTTAVRSLMMLLSWQNASTANIKNLANWPRSLKLDSGYRLTSSWYWNIIFHWYTLLHIVSDINQLYNVLFHVRKLWNNKGRASSFKRVT